MNIKMIKITAAVIAAAVMCGCSPVETLPSEGLETDLPDNVLPSVNTVSVTAASEDMPAAAETAPPPVSETTAPVTTVSETEGTSMTDETFAVGTDLSSARPEVTVLTVPAETSTAAEPDFVPGTLPPPETSAVKTSPAITVLTIPKNTDTAVVGGNTTYPSETAAHAVSETQQYFPASSYYPLNFGRQKGMWVSYLEFDRIMKNNDEEEFTRQLGICFDNIAAIGCNTVYFQVRVYGDAYYKSSLFPKGDRLSGDYDPLAIAVKSAHDRGLSIHAWVNPMRLMTGAQMQSIPQSYKIGEWYADGSKNGTYLVNSNGRYYLNPAYAETVSLICDGISEIVTAYDVDGVQIDDYFYPTTDTSFDSAAYAASGTSLSLADWRRENVTKMVRKMYSAVHSANPSAVFGISPQGNLGNNYNDLYADIYTWCSASDCCDYICPQIYFGFNNAALPYQQTVEEWSKLVTNSRISLVIGLAAYKSGTQDKYAGAGSNEWIDYTDILARQRDLTDSYNAGYAFFRYDSLFMPEPSVSATVSRELENLRK